MEDSEARPKRPSIYDVAERAGVSHMTVSRVLNDSPNIRASTRARVELAIEETGYRPSHAARELVTQRSMRIGAVVYAPTLHGPKSTLLGIESAARRQGYGVSAYSLTDSDDDELSMAVVSLKEQGVDGLCIVGPIDATSTVYDQPAWGLPIVVVGEREPGEVVTGVGIDQADGSAQAMRHLLGLGHRSILHLAGPLDTSNGKARAGAWRTTLDAAGLRADRVVVGGWSSESGYAIGASYQDLSEVSAVFAANDQMALGFMHGLWTRGIRVPTDFSVVGFDDIPDAAHFIPPLTTVHQDFEALGTAVLDALLGATRDHQPAPSTLLRPRLIIRDSTAPPTQESTET